MFRLIKLAVLGLMGYAIYEFIRGLSGAQAAGGGQQGNRQGGQSRREPAPHLGAGNMQFTGSGEGQRVETADAAGTTTPHFVGRGVVQR